MFRDRDGYIDKDFSANDDHMPYHLPFLTSYRQSRQMTMRDVRWYLINLKEAI